MLACQLQRGTMAAVAAGWRQSVGVRFLSHAGCCCPFTHRPVRSNSTANLHTNIEKASLHVPADVSARCAAVLPLRCAAGGAGGAKLGSMSAGAPSGSSIKALSGGETGGLRDIMGGATGGLKDLSGGNTGGLSDITGAATAGHGSGLWRLAMPLARQRCLQQRQGRGCSWVHQPHAALLQGPMLHTPPEALSMPTAAAAAAGGQTGGLSDLTGADTVGLSDVRDDVGVTGGLADIRGGRTGGLADIQTEGSAVGRLSDIGPDRRERS